MQAKHGTVTKEKLIELYVNDPHASMPSVAEKLGVSRSTVIKAMRRFGLESKPRGTVPDVEIPELSNREWLEDQLKGKTFRQLAKELGTSVGRIADRAYRYGIANPSTKKSAAIKEAMKKRYPDGRNGAEAANWKGGVRETKQGYIKVYSPDHPNASSTGYVFQHRLVMEEALGRYLNDDEIVHHINGDKKDNRPGNLEVKKNGDHISEHFKASHEVTVLRKKLIELEAELEKYKVLYGTLPK